MPPISPRVGADKAPTEKTTIRLDPERRAQVMKWGGGNASAGIRFAIDQCSELVSGGIDPQRRMLRIMILPTNATDQRIFTEILEFTLRSRDKFLKKDVCKRIVGSNEKNSERRDTILRQLTTDRFLQRSDIGYRPIVRSNQIVDNPTFRELFSDYRDYLRGVGKFVNMLDVIDE